MKRPTNWNLARLCTILGAVMLVAAGLVMGLWLWNNHASVAKAENYVQTIRSLLPEPENAPLEARKNTAMANLSVDGVNFLGLLEMPRFGSVTPVCADWGKIRQFPCRLSGSIYDGTMQIGATSQQGQYDFYREISAGDRVYFTDMEGNRYSYTVTDIRYEQHADQAALQRKEADMTLFIQNLYGFEYIVIFCTANSI